MISLRSRKIPKGPTALEANCNKQEVSFRNDAHIINSAEQSEPSTPLNLHQELTVNCQNEKSVVVGKKRGRKPKLLQHIVKEKQQINENVTVTENLDYNEKIISKRRRVTEKTDAHLNYCAGNSCTGCISWREDTKIRVSEKKVIKVAPEKKGSNESERKKRGRKPLALNAKKLIEPNAENKKKKGNGMSSVAVHSVHTIHVRVKPLIKCKTPKSTGIPSTHLEGDAEKMHQESTENEGKTQSEEPKDAANLTCQNMDLRSLRRVKVKDSVCPSLGKELQDCAAVSNLNSCKIESAEDGQKTRKNRRQHIQSSNPEDTINKKNKCLTTSSPCPLPSLSYPVVKLHNCNKLQNLLNCSDLKKSSFKLENMISSNGVKETDLQECVLHCSTDLPVSCSNHNCSGKEKEKSEKLAPTVEENGVQIRKVRWVLRRKVMEKNKHSTGRPAVNKRPSDTVVVKEKNEQLKEKAGHTINLKSSNLIIRVGDLNDDENNNKRTHASGVLEENTQEHNSCLLVDTDGVRSPDAISNFQKNPNSNDAEFSVVKNVPLEYPNAKIYAVDKIADDSLGEVENHSHVKHFKKENQLFSCQRSVPFTGRTIWNCSCARTGVWSFPRKIACPIQTTDNSHLKFALVHKNEAKTVNNKVKTLIEIAAGASNNTRNKKSLDSNLNNGHFADLPSKIADFDHISVPLVHENEAKTVINKVKTSIEIAEGANNDTRNKKSLDSNLNNGPFTGLQSKIADFDQISVPLVHENESKTVIDKVKTSIEIAEGANNDTRNKKSLDSNLNNVPFTYLPTKIGDFDQISVPQIENIQLESDLFSLSKERSDTVDLPMAVDTKLSGKCSINASSTDNVENIQTCTLENPHNSSHFKVPIINVEKAPKHNICESYAKEPMDSFIVSENMSPEAPDEAVLSEMKILHNADVKGYAPPSPQNVDLELTAQSFNKHNGKDDQSPCSVNKAETAKGTYCYQGSEQDRTELLSSDSFLHDTSLVVPLLPHLKTPINAKKNKYKMQNTPDALITYEDDILVIDVIQDDPELFGYSKEEESNILEMNTEKPMDVLFTSNTKSTLSCKLPEQVKSSVLESTHVNRGFQNSHTDSTNFSTLLSVKKSNGTHTQKKPQHTGTASDAFPATTSTSSVKKSNGTHTQKTPQHTGAASDAFPATTSTSSEKNPKIDSPGESSSLEAENLFEEDHVIESEVHSINFDNEDESFSYANDYTEDPHDDRKRFRFHDPLPVKRPPEASHIFPPKMYSSSNTENSVPLMNDFRYAGKSIPTLDKTNPEYNEKWKSGNNFFNTLPMLPFGYCRYFFKTPIGCTKPSCTFWHVPQGDEKLCMKTIRNFVDLKEIPFLRRAVWLFTNYYHLYLPGVHYCSEVLTDLTNTLLNRSMWQEVLCLMEAGSVVKILPSVETLIKLFDQIASAGLSKTIPVLVDMLCKLLEAGTVFTPEHSNRVIKILNQLHATQTDINIVLAMLSRFDTKQSIKNYLCDLDLAIAEIEHCKEKNEWVKLGTLYLNSRKGSENLTDLKKVSSCIAKALMKDLKEDQLETPYCKFTHAVQAESQLNEVDRNILGSIGISVLYNYYRNELWEKGKLVLNRLRKMQIPFTVLKGLIGKEPLASRCQVVNIAAEIYLKCRNLQSALWVLKESEWIINTSIWPCDRMDVLNRHNLLCTIANETLSKSMFLVCFEVLQNLPGLQDSESVVDVCQYGNIFNSLLSSCIENKSLAISSSVSDFMASKKIPIDFSLLRMLITVLGQSCLWLRARIHYKCALSLGCYPPLEGNLYRKILNIPSCMSEVEMLLAIEIFLVTHASSIQSPGGSNQTLQIILKRNEENMLCDEIYQSAARRLIQASRLSAPRLFLKHMTVNKTNDQVYSLEHSSSVKWLSENMKWAGKVWLFR